MNYKLEIKTLTCTTHATPHPTDHLTGLPRIRVANTMLTPKTKPREIARVYYKTNKCSSSAEIERSRVSLASRGWAAASRPSDHPEQPSASDGGGNEKVSRGSGEGCSTHLECWSKSSKSQEQLRVARLGEVVQNATPRSPAARRFGANSSTESSPEPATSSRACRAPPNCRIPTASSRIPAATRRYGAVPSSNLAAMSANDEVQGGEATL